MKRRLLLQGLAGQGVLGPLLVGALPGAWAGDIQASERTPILVVLEMTGGNDGLNTVVPHGDDEYYRLRPKIGIPRRDLLPLDDHFGLNPGMSGLHRLWQQDQLALVHGCGYDNPSYSHFTSMAYWHTGVPNGGDEFGWLGRVADAMPGSGSGERIVGVGSHQSLALKSRRHSAVVFDDPLRFARQGWPNRVEQSHGEQGGTSAAASPSNADFLRATAASARSSSEVIRRAWQAYQPQVDYGLVPMDLPKIAACIKAKLPTQLYHASVRNNAFDPHVQQPALHRRLLSYVSDAVSGFIQEMKLIGQSDRVVVLMYSEFGRRPMENANLGTDHGSANLMLVAGEPVQGGHYGVPPTLRGLGEGDNVAHSVDFRQVYATVIQGWLGLPAEAVLGARFRPLPIFGRA